MWWQWVGPWPYLERVADMAQDMECDGPGAAVVLRYEDC